MWCILNCWLIIFILFYYGIEDFRSWKRWSANAHIWIYIILYMWVDCAYQMYQKDDYINIKWCAEMNILKLIFVNEIYCIYNGEWIKNVVYVFKVSLSCCEFHLSVRSCMALRRLQKGIIRLWRKRKSWLCRTWRNCSVMDNWPLLRLFIEVQLFLWQDWPYFSREIAIF